jgi:hypothetical protein
VPTFEGVTRCAPGRVVSRSVAWSYVTMAGAEHESDQRAVTVASGQRTRPANSSVSIV